MPPPRHTRGHNPALCREIRSRTRPPAPRRAPPRKASPRPDISAKWNRGSEPECSLLRAGALLSHDAGILSGLSLERTLDRGALLIELQRIRDFLHLVVGQAGVKQRLCFELIVAFHQRERRAQLLVGGSELLLLEQRFTANIVCQPRHGFLLLSPIVIAYALLLRLG